MNEYTLAEVFEAVYKQEFAEFDDPPKHFFSLRHRRAMREILRTAPTPAAKRKLPLKKKLLIALLVILLSMIGIAAGAQISRSFAFDEIGGKTYLFAVNDKNAPTEISTLYHLPTVPDGFELLSENLGTYNVFITYFERSAERSLFLYQNVKNGCYFEYDEEKSYLEETKINGDPAYYLCLYDNGGVIIWDNKDYILEVGGDFSKDELISFAESVEKINE